MIYKRSKLVKEGSQFYGISWRAVAFYSKVVRMYVLRPEKVVLFWR